MKAIADSKPPRTAWSIGYVVLDVLLHEERVGHSAGGTAGNVAANLAFFGWHSEVIGLYGPDPAGFHLRSDLQRAGVSTSKLICRSDLTTPVVLHEVLSDSHRFRFGCPECGRKFPNFRAVSKDFADELSRQPLADVLFLDRVSSAAVTLAASVRKNGGLVVFEPSMPVDSPRFRALVESAHVLKFSAERLDPGSPMLRSCDALQIYTDGPRGAYWKVTTGSRWHHVPGFETKVIDAGGAGDWTTAAFLSALPTITPSELYACEIGAALEYAQRVAAISCQALGARGLSSSLTRTQLLDRVAQLQPRELGIKETHTPTRSRRRAGCSACLSRQSSESSR